MSLQGPILLVAGKTGDVLAEALAEAGAFPVVEVSWAGAPTAFAEVKPAAVVAVEPDRSDCEVATALAQAAAVAAPFAPLLLRGRDGGVSPTLPNALWLGEDAPAERVVARLACALRLRTLHSTVLARAQTLEAERGIVAELPQDDPLDDAAVLVIGRGRHHPTLSVAVGERMGVMGALSVEAAARCLNARDLDGVVVGDGLSAHSVGAFLALLADDARFRDLPVAVLGAFSAPAGLPNFVCARDPDTLIARAVPLIRMRALETALKRLLNSIEHKGMIDAVTGLFNADAFGAALDLAIGDSAERGTTLSLARFSFEQPIERRVGVDAARLVSRLMRDTDFACRQDDGSILFAFGDTALRDAHVAARRLASVLRHTMLRLDRERPAISPTVTLATLKPTDTQQSLLERVSARPVAAA